jgi:hypothetical protein
VESLPWPLIGAGAGWTAFLTLAFLVLRAVVKGDFIPRSTHERELQAAEHNSNEWRAEGRIKDQMMTVDLDSIKRTGEETGRSLHKFIADLQRVIGIKANGEGEP